MHTHKQVGGSGGRAGGKGGWRGGGRSGARGGGGSGGVGGGGPVCITAFSQSGCIIDFDQQQQAGVSEVGPLITRVLIVIIQSALKVKQRETSSTTKSSLIYCSRHIVLYVGRKLQREKMVREEVG